MAIFVDVCQAFIETFWFLSHDIFHKRPQIILIHLFVEIQITNTDFNNICKILPLIGSLIG